MRVRRFYIRLLPELRGPSNRTAYRLIRFLL